jgi:hypothetical protein
LVPTSKCVIIRQYGLIERWWESNCRSFTLPLRGLWLASCVSWCVVCINTIYIYIHCIYCTDVWCLVVCCVYRWVACRCTGVWCVACMRCVQVLSTMLHICRAWLLYVHIPPTISICVVYIFYVSWAGMYGLARNDLKKAKVRMFNSLTELANFRHIKYLSAKIRLSGNSSGICRSWHQFLFHGSYMYTIHTIWCCNLTLHYIMDQITK